MGSNEFKVKHSTAILPDGDLKMGFIEQNRIIFRDGAIETKRLAERMIVGKDANKFQQGVELRYSILYQGN